MNIIGGKITGVEDTITRNISTGGTYHIVSSYGYAGIEWGTVKVVDIIPYRELPDMERGAYEDSGMESSWLDDPWIVYVYRESFISDRPNCETQYMPAELFIRHTVAP